MSNDIKKLLVRDNRLHVQDKINFAVFQGAQNLTKQQYKNNSVSTTSVTFNIQVPSEQTMIDRRVFLESTIVFKLAAPDANVPNGKVLFDYGRSAGFGPFPLHQCMQTQSVTINSATVTQNIKDNISVLLRMLKEEDLAYYNSYSPSAPDNYFSYVDALAAINNPLGGYQNSALGKVLPRGAFQIISTGKDANLNNDQIVAPNVGCGACYVKAKFIEPLMISPFIYNPSLDMDCSALYGVQNLSMNFTLGDANRAIRCAVAGVNATLDSVSDDTKLLFTFMTPKPSQLLPAQNVLKYYECPRFITKLAKLGQAVQTGSATSSSIQLNQIPQFLWVFVRKIISSQRPDDADSFYPITSCNIQFNNLQGILSSATQADLYRMSVENGYNTNWQEWNGKAQVYNNGAVNNLRTVGGALCLMFGKDIQLTEDFYSIGSLGNFNLEVKVNFENPYYNLADPDLELVLVPMNVGAFVTSKGVSNVYTGLLTKQDVLDANAGEAVSENEVKRFVGGAFTEKAMGLLNKALESAPAVLKTVCKVQDIMGSGKTGAGSSGGMARRLK